MDKSIHIPQQATDSETTPVKFWGNIALSVLIILANIALLRNILQVPKTTTSYIAMAVHVLVIIAGFAVILSTLRGQQKMGAQIVFYTAIVLFASGPFLYTGRALTATFSLITVSAITITQLLPKELRRRSIVIAGVALMIMWMIEWITPSWRLTSAVSNVGWASSILFALILGVIVIHQAWGGNIRVKIVTSYTVIALISVVAVGAIVYFSYRNQIREDMRQRMLNIVSLVAMNQNGDLHSTIQGPENAEDKAHVDILAQNVDYLATDPDLKYIYTMRKNEQGQIYFVINARQGGEPGDPIGTMYNEPSELLRMHFDTLSEPVVEEDIYTDTYGSVLPAYAPFYRSDGTREGIIGVDIDAEKVLAAERAVFFRILATTLVAMVIVTLIGLWLGNTFAAPVINLSRATQKIIEGDLNARATVESADEVGDLAKAFNQMTSQLQETLQGLEQHVAERTRHLVLAAGVGRAVSQVRDLDVLLTDACELILKEFDLYYVQVYLTDASASTLKLEAGTGMVGAQLLKRGHRLPLHTGSINGRAAVEKHSVVISDTARSATFRQNPLLPETRGEMAVPLIVADKVVGVLDMQSREAGVLNEEVLPAFEALAGQLAVAIQNANLLKEANEARAEVEKQARRLARTNWNEYLDAIHKPEEIGFVFGQDEVIPLVRLNEFQVDENTISSPISVTGEPLGSLTVQIGDPSRKDQAIELVKIIAQQMAQQIENLRLIESAERYRHKAELAVRRTMLEGWQQFVESRKRGKVAYRYDTHEVQPVSQDPESASLTLPIKTRDQAIGKVSILGSEVPDSASLEIVNTVMERLGDHVESLRQYGQARNALAQSEKLFDASSQISQATGLQELVAAVVTTLEIPAANRALLTTFQYGSSGEIEELTIIGNWWNGTGHEVTPVGTRYSRDVMQVMPMFISPTPVFFDDVFNDERVDPTTMEQVAKRLNLRTIAVLPLYSANQQIGALVLEGEEPHTFTQEEIRLFSSLAPQIATAVENRRQYEMAQRQAQREAMLNAIGQKIQSATSVEAVLQIAARELGRALDASKAIAQLGVFKRNGGNGNNENGYHS
ncbi:MAG: GAF domain-containing protein [Chloroflexi bacterium]|nr:GAF domain-containing protein [Chloroflexota bacterium]